MLIQYNQSFADYFIRFTVDCDSRFHGKLFRHFAITTELQ